MDVHHALPRTLIVSGLVVVGAVGVWSCKPNTAQAALLPPTGIVEAAPVVETRVQASSMPVTLSVPEGGITSPALDPVAPPTAPREQLPEAWITDYFSRYVIVDLSEQRLYRIEHEKTFDSWLVSTGLPGTPTNIGTWHVFSRIERERMSGPGYDLYPVMYTQYFDGEGEALHGAYWHSNWGHPMSHGCVNMSNERAKELWGWSPPRMKVIVRQ